MRKGEGGQSHVVASCMRWCPLLSLVHPPVDTSQSLMTVTAHVQPPDWDVEKKGGVQALKVHTSCRTQAENRQPRVNCSRGHSDTASIGRELQIKEVTFTSKCYALYHCD